MEVKPGYKQTEVGVIPEEWEVPYLRRHLLQDATYGVVKAGAFQRSGIPMLRSGEIKNASIIEDHPLITLEKSQEYSRTILKKNDVVIALVGYPGETAVIPDRLIGANISRAVGLLRPASNLTPEFLACYLNSPNGRKEFLRPSAGSAQIVVNLGALNKLRLPVPSLPEQRAIATALSDVDGLLGGLARLIAKKRDLKQAAMQQLLTGQTRLPGFHGEWEVKSFAAVLLRLNAKAHQIQTTDYQSSGRYPVVDQGKEVVISFSDQEEKRLQCPEGGVIVFGDHTCIVKFIDFDFLVGADGTQILQGKAGQSTRFHSLQVQYRGVESTGYNRHFKFLKEREFLAPSLPEQTAIASVLTEMDGELAVLEQRREKTRALKQAMMQELLTGRTRLV